MDWTFSIGSLSFGIFDIILVAISVISAICGFARGFSRFAFKLIGYVLTFPLALIFVSALMEFLSSKVNIPVFWLSLISYVILCLLIFSLFKLLGNLLGTSLETMSLGWIDSALGFVVALVVAAFVVFVLLELVSLQTVFDMRPLKENSFFYKNLFFRIFPTVKSTFEGAISGL